MKKVLMEEVEKIKKERNWNVWKSKIYIITILFKKSHIKNLPWKNYQQKNQLL
jgi:hypothetical protein